MGCLSQMRQLVMTPQQSMGIKGQSHVGSWQRFLAYVVTTSE